MFRGIQRALLLAGLAAAAACADRNPAGVGDVPAAPSPAIRTALRCEVDVRARRLSCAAPSPETTPGVSAALIGGQGANVRVTSADTRYDAATGTMRSDVTVENLMATALGTTDGAFPTAEGVRVFFHDGPTVTDGSGLVSVLDADGEATFTGALQPYYQYAGPLAPGAVSAPREWRFSVPATVNRFVFTVHVSAAVAEAGTPPAAVLFLAGSGAADTVEAVVDSVLRIGVRGADGRPAPGELVEVTPMPVAQYPYELEATFGFPGQPPYLYTAGWVYTNAAGILELRVKLGRRAGAARISVVAPRLGVGDTARFTIRPGRATGVRSLPVDTTITTGTRAPLRLNTVDRWGNARRDAEPVSLTVAAGPGRAEGSGVVGGDSIGQVTAVAAYGGWRDTTYVRVAPAGMVAVTGSADNTAQAAALYTLPLDASTVKRVRTTIVGSGYFGSMDVAWLGRDRLVYHDNRLNHGKLVYTLDLGTGAWGRLLPAADQMEMEYLPRASRDGAWVYFSAGPATWSYHLYRARPDGTGLERLSSATPAAQYEWGSDPSPDGTRVVFSKDGAVAVDEVHLMTIATRQTRALNLRGTSPRWSPDGSRIALLGRRDATEPVRLLLVAPDGSDARTLSTTILYGNIDWTPDGRYLVGSTGGNRLVIVEVATGKELLVPVAGIEGGMLFGGARP